MKISLIGVGRWGSKIYKVLNNLNVLKSIYDKEAGVTKDLDMGGVICASGYEEILEDEEVRGVVIATPMKDHYEYVKRGLLGGKDVYVEKPMMTNEEEGKEVLEISRRGGKILMVGHIMNYQSGIQKLKEEMGRIGELRYIYAERLNGEYIWEEEEDILWSLGVHDISLFLNLVGEARNFYEVGRDWNEKKDQTMIHMEYANGVRGHIFVSRLLPYKKQKVVLMGDEGVLIFEDEEEEKLLYYQYKRAGSESGERFNGHESIGYARRDALEEEMKHYIECIEERREPETNGEEGLKALKMIHGLMYGKSKR